MTAEEALKRLRSNVVDPADAQYLDALESALREKDEKIAELEAQVAADFTTVAEMEAECNELRMRNPLRQP